jgi:thiosulfate reductase / polysulfide reductase chain A
MAMIRTVCQSCHSECGVLARVEDGRVVRLQGDPGHPSSKGYICTKGKNEIGRLYHPDRLLYPLKRAGARGEGKWQRISWDEALDGIAAGLTEVRDRYGADAICGMRGTGPRAGGVSNLVPYSLGSPNAISCDLHICYAPSLIAENATIGTSCLMERGPDYENARCILVFGGNPLISHPPRGRDLLRGRIRNGAKLIVVDPRRTYLAEKADLWLQVRPGTDAALALSLINEIVERGLYDGEFVQRWCVGFEELTARAAEYPAERVAEITWVPADQIRAAAELYATTKPAVLHHRVAMDQNLCSTQSSRALIDLVAITGNLDVEGGNLLPPRIPGYFRTGILSGGGPCAPPPQVEERRLGAGRFPLASSPRGRFCGGPTLMFVHAHLGMEAMEGKNGNVLRAMYLSGGNPLVTTMDVRRFRDAMLNLDLLVVADYFMTPSAEIADYVLPAATWLERDELCDDGYTDFIAARQKAVEPQGEARDDLEIVIDLVRRIPWADHARLPWSSRAECNDWAIAGMGLTFDQLKERGYYVEPARYRKYEQDGFDTASGKVELAASLFGRLGYDPLPHYVEPSESPTGGRELFADYPLVLTSGARQIEYMTSEGRQVAALREARPDPEIDVHPETATRLGLAGGAWAWLETPRKPGERVKLKVKVTDAMDPRVVSASYGWWFPEQPGPEHGCFDSNVNVVLDMGPPWEEICGSVPLRATLCRLTPARPDASRF